MYEGPDETGCGSGQEIISRGTAKGKFAEGVFECPGDECGEDPTDGEGAPLAGGSVPDASCRFGEGLGEGQREEQRGLGAAEGRQRIERRGGADRAEDHEPHLDDLSLHGE